MEPFSLATGIAGLISLAIGVTTISQEYISAVKEAPQHIQDLSNQTQVLGDVLTQLMKFLRSDDAEHISFQADSALPLVQKSCEKQLERICKKLNKFHGADKSKLSSTVARLVWPFEKGECVEVTKRLQEWAQTFHFCLTVANCEKMAKSHEELVASLKTQQKSIDDVAKMLPIIPAEIASLSEEIKSVISAVSISAEEIHDIHGNVLVLRGESDRRLKKEILQWLSPLEPYKRHHDVRTVRLAGTCQWILQHPDFLNWSSDTPTNRALCCFGAPGAGKTVASSFVIDALSKREDIRIAYMYCDYRDQLQQTTINILGALLKLLLAALPNLPKEVVATYKQTGPFELPVAKKMFEYIFQAHKTIYICLDALDECKDAGSLMEFFQVMPPTVRLFATGRKNVETTIHRYFQDALVIPIKANENDVRAYIKTKLDENRTVEPEALDSQLEEEIIEKISALAGEMFLLPTLHIRMVLEAQTRRKRRLALEELPPQLNDAFGNTMERIKQQPRASADQAMRVLTWVHLTERPLSVDELLHALAIEIGDSELHRDNFPGRKTFLDCCLGLVVVDDETATVRLVHYSLEEYFETVNLFPHGHQDIVNTCLTYLMFDHLSTDLVTTKGEKEIQDLLSRFILFDYAVCEWVNHARKDPIGEITLGLILNYLLNPRNRISSIFGFYRPFQGNYNFMNYHLYRRGRSHRAFSALHMAAFFGIHQVIPSLILHSLDPNGFDCDIELPPYSWRRGQLTMTVELLLHIKSINLNSSNTKSSDTPLHYAVKAGHEDTVKALLANDRIDPNRINSRGDTPLICALRGSTKSIVKVLLTRDDLEINMRGYNDLSALHHAARNANLTMLELLLQKDGVDVNVKDDMGLTPLATALAWNFPKLAGRDGRESIKVLLRRADVDINCKDNEGHSILWFARQCGDEEIVNLLKNDPRLLEE